MRNLQNRLLVATQLCAMTGRDISRTYNEFVQVNRATLQGANGVLRAQFAAAFAKNAERHYDAFVTGQANAFGTSHKGQETCRAAEAAAAEGAAAQGHIETLLDLHDRMTDQPELPGGRCGISFTPGAVRTAALAIKVKVEKVDPDEREPEFGVPDVDAAVVSEVFAGRAAKSADAGEAEVKRAAAGADGGESRVSPRPVDPADGPTEQR